jgi:hypothetical protein
MSTWNRSKKKYINKIKDSPYRGGVLLKVAIKSLPENLM